MVAVVLPMTVKAVKHIYLARQVVRVQDTAAQIQQCLAGQAYRDKVIQVDQPAQFRLQLHHILVVAVAVPVAQDNLQEEQAEQVKAVMVFIEQLQVQVLRMLAVDLLGILTVHQLVQVHHIMAADQVV